MKLKFGSKAIDFRVSTLPTLFARVVIRSSTPPAPSWHRSLGYEKVEKDRLMPPSGRPYA